MFYKLHKQDKWSYVFKTAQKPVRVSLKKSSLKNTEIQKLPIPTD